MPSRTNFLKPAQRGVDRVVAGEQVGENEISLLIALGRGGDVSRQVGGAHFGAADHGAALVGDATDNRSPAFLRVSEGGESQERNGNSYVPAS